MIDSSIRVEAKTKKRILIAHMYVYYSNENVWCTNVPCILHNRFAVNT